MMADTVSFVATIVLTRHFEYVYTVATSGSAVMARDNTIGGTASHRASQVRSVGMNWQSANRRRFLALSGATGVAALLAACGQAATHGASPTAQSAASTTQANAAAAATPAPVTGAMNSTAAATATSIAHEAVKASQGANVVQFIYWHAWTGAAGQMVITVANNFNKSHPDIQVTPQVIPGADFDTKALAAVAAGNPPDAMMLWNSYGRVYAYAAQKALTPLEDVATDVNKLKDWVLPTIWDLGTYKGKLYVLPQWSQAYGLFYNKDMFKEAGLDPEKPPATTDELFAAAQKLTQKDASGNLKVLGFGGSTWLYIWQAAFGGSLVDDSGSKITANDPKNVEALDYLASFAKAAGPKKFADYNAQTTAGAGGVVQYPLVSKRVAMYVDGVWGLQTIQRTAPEGFNYGTAWIPKPADGYSPSLWTYGDCPAIPAGVKHPQQSAVYVEYLTGFGGEDAYVSMMEQSNLQTPSSRKPYDDGKLANMIKQYPGLDLLYKEYFQAKGKGVLTPAKIPVGGVYDKALTDAHDEVLLGQLTAKQALDNVTQSVQAELDKWQSTYK